MLDAPITGRQILGIFVLVALAIALLRALPPGSLYSRLMSHRWDVTPREGFGQPARLDYVRYALKVSGAGIVVLAGGFLIFGELLARTRVSTPADFWVGVGVLATTLIGGLCLLSGPVLIGRAVFWRAWPQLPYLVLAKGVKVGETNLEHRALEHGIVGGGVRPLRGFSTVVASVGALSSSLSASPDVTQRRHMIRAFSAEGGWQVIERAGDAIAAHDVCMVDLGRLGIGQGYWVELTVPDTSVWSTEVVPQEAQ